MTGGVCVYFQIHKSPHMAQSFSFLLVWLYEGLLWLRRRAQRTAVSIRSTLKGSCKKKREMKRWSSVLYGLINARISDILYQSCSFWKGQRKNNLFVEIREDSYIVAVGEEEEVNSGVGLSVQGSEHYGLSVTGPGRLLADESKERKKYSVHVLTSYNMICGGHNH